MDDSICFLIIIYYNGELLRCALKIEAIKLTRDCIEFPSEPESRKELNNLLPSYMRNAGEIVEVQEIFEICDLT